MRASQKKNIINCIIYVIEYDEMTKYLHEDKKYVIMQILYGVVKELISTKCILLVAKIEYFRIKFKTHYIPMRKIDKYV